MVLLELATEFEIDLRPGCVCARKLLLLLQIAIWLNNIIYNCLMYCISVKLGQAS